MPTVDEYFKREVYFSVVKPFLEKYNLPKITEEYSDKDTILVMARMTKGQVLDLWDEIDCFHRSVPPIYPGIE